MKVKKLSPAATIPHYTHQGDSGFDLRAIESALIAPNGRAKVRTGLAFQLPAGHEMQIRPRSGLSLLEGLSVILGTIDCGYRGEVGIIVHNISEHTISITPGMRIAQGVVAPVTTVNIVEVDELDLSSRGTGGFGSTGL